MPKFYKANVLCTNCDKRDTMSIVIGQLIAEQVCNNCGCKKLIRGW